MRNAIRTLKSRTSVTVFLAAALFLWHSIPQAASAQFGVAASINRDWVSIGGTTSEGPVAQGSGFVDVVMAEDSAGFSTWGLTFGAGLAGTRGASITSLSVEGWRVWKDVEFFGGPLFEVWDAGLVGELSFALGAKGGFIFEGPGGVDFQVGGFVAPSMSGVDGAAHSGIFFGPRISVGGGES